MGKSRSRTDSWDGSQLKRETIRDFCKMIRAEAGAYTGLVLCIVEGRPTRLLSESGFCYCVTCGNLLKWNGAFRKGGKGAHGGHWLPGKRNSVVYRETNCHCQCPRCNMNPPKGLGGNRPMYDKYMFSKYGLEEMQVLTFDDDNVSITYLDHDLHEMRDGYRDRWKAAVKLMDQT